MAARKAFPKALGNDKCDAVITRFIDCVGSDCINDESFTDLKAEFEKSCAELAEKARRTRSGKIAAGHSKGVCDTAKARRCTQYAHKDFRAAMTAQSKEQCEDTVRTYMDCVALSARTLTAWHQRWEDCASASVSATGMTVSKVREQLENACAALAQLEGRVAAKASGSGSASMRARCDPSLCRRPQISLPHVY